MGKSKLYSSAMPYGEDRGILHGQENLGGGREIPQGAKIGLAYFKDKVELCKHRSVV